MGCGCKKKKKPAVTTTTDTTKLTSRPLTEQQQALIERIKALSQQK